MKDLNEIWSRMQVTKREQKQLKRLYRDSLETSHDYRGIMEDMKVLKEKKAAIEAQAKADLAREYERLLVIAKDLGLDKELLTDVAITTLMSGAPVMLKDEAGNEYEPVFSVRFRKVNT